MNEPLAIIGISCRLPGGANSPDAYWTMMCAGTDAISEIRADRWNIAAHYDASAGGAGKSTSKWGGFIDNINRFDSSFFGISAQEADAMDPQQRLLLETTWEAFEDAGEKWEELRGSPTGVFVGISTSDYASMQYDSGGSSVSDIYSAPGCAFSIAANRISYCLDLRGPSVAMDTACSSALTACHVACQSLWRGDCQMAVVAGVNALLNQNSFVAFSRMSMLSPDGRCKAFDARANGFVRSEGVGAVILKPLSSALQANDRIYAMIRATAANQDGRTNGITVPSRHAQEALIRKACEAAGISPGAVGYIEAHGTGTAVGDPIEAAALGAALRQGRKSPCLIGSVKTNIGHLEAASGIASLIKVALILKHKQIPPNLHFQTPNPHIDFDGLNLRVVDRLQAFPDHAGALLAGVNSFGFGGANAHVILESAPARNGHPEMNSALGRLLLPLAAHSQAALREAAGNYAAQLLQEDCDARTTCGAAATRRSGFAHRLCAQADSRQELAASLQQFAAGENIPSIVAGEALDRSGPVFVFSGQGTQWWGMGRELIRSQPLFRSKIEECDAIFRSLGPWSLIEELSRGEEESRLHQTALAQPAIFAIQVALANLWISWGISPSAVVGHSVGEAAAAHVAGVLSLDEAARVIFHRGRTMDAASNRGRMLAAALSAVQAEEMVSGYSGQVGIGAYNGPTSVTLSGEPGPLDRIARRLDELGIFHRFLKVNYAFHSHQMDAVKGDLLESLGEVKVSPPHTPLYSTVSGRPFADGDFSADYWWRNVRCPVRFSEAITGLSSQGHRLFLELSAHPALTGSIAETLSAHSAPGKSFCSLRRMEPEMETMLHTLGSLHVAGAAIDWAKLYPGDYAEAALPSYPWQHEEHWRETRAARSARLDSSPHFFLNRRIDSAEPAWYGSLDMGANRWLKDHRVLDHILFPGSAMIEAALEAGTEIFGAVPVAAEDIEFKEALAFPEGKETIELQTAYSPADSSLRFSSRRQSDGEWTLRAAAKVRAHSGVPARALHIERLKKTLAVRLDHEQIYAHCRQQGLDYGPAFQGLERVWRSGSQALGKIELPDQLITEKMQFHPAMLDACFQTMVFACPESQGQQTYLPVGVDRFVLLARPGEASYCHARLTQQSQRSATWDLQICGEDGRVIAYAEGLRTQAVRGSGRARASAPAEWLYETKWIEKPLLGSKERQKVEGKWLILADRLGAAKELAALLRERGAMPLLLAAENYLDRSGNGHAILSDRLAADLKAILAAHDGTGGAALAGVVHLWSLDAADRELDASSFARAEALTCHALLRTMQALGEAHCAAPVWIVTRGAQCVSAEDLASVAQSLAIGMGRTMMAEFPRVRFELIDVDAGTSRELAQSLWREIASGDDETEVAWRGEKRYASRIAHRSLYSLTGRPRPGGSKGYSLQIPASGVMDELAWCEQPPRRPAADEIEIEVHAAAMNFRDVLKSLGLYPIECDRDLLLGDECSGRVISVGKAVTAFKPGDEVIASGAGCFRSHLTIPDACAIRKPARLSFEEAATIPVAFMTAWHALHNLGRIRRGESILIHSAAGGVGLAAMQIAKLAGAEIYATAGNKEKRKYLRRLGARQVFDSRTTAFAAQVRSATKGRGVDLVLNSLAGDAIAKGLSALAPGGRFLEIGKRDIYANTAIGLRPLRNNVSMHVIDMGQILSGSRSEVQNLLQSVMKLFRSGALLPLPYSLLPFSRAAEAFRQMAQAKHIGKIVLSAKNDRIEPIRKLPLERIEFSRKGSYLITGGLGGFGLEVARWLVSRGARNLVLAGRSGASTPEARRAVAALRRKGVKVTVAKADISDASQVERLMRAIASGETPLRGIFHAAMVIDDGILTQLTPARFTRVLAPKAAGAWNLHQASLKLPLDYFVLFSSVSSLLGTPGQANYVAANCFLDALAHHRRALSLPALAINWGAIKEVGFLARNQAVAGHLASHGVEGIAPAQATEMLGRLLQSDSTQIGFAQIDWQKFVSPAPGSSPAPRFSEVVAAASPAEAGDSRNFRAVIQSAPPARQLEIAASLISETVAEIMRIDAAKLDAGRPLNEMGLDSLMAFEMINRLEDRFGVSLPTRAISSSSTINNLAAIVLEGCGIKGSPTAPLGAEIGKTVVPAGASQTIVLRAGEDGTPLFFIHPVGGGTEIYAELAALVPPGFKVYGISSRMMAGLQDEWETLEDLARSYAEILAGFQREGPMRIAGFSAGSIFALATARELERRGRTVSFVGAIEAPFAALDPNCPRETILKSMILEIFDWLAGEHVGEQSGPADRLDESTLGLARSLLDASGEEEQLRMIPDWFAAHGVHLGEGKLGASALREVFRRVIRHTMLINQSKIEPVNAPVWSWQADRSEITHEGSSLDVRQNITSGSFTHAVVSGRHFDVMTQPFVGALASQFSAALANSENDGAEEPAATVARRTEAKLFELTNS